MPTVAIRNRTNLSANIDYVSPVVAIADAIDARIRLNPSAEFDDPTLAITVTVELSLDGGTTWPHATTATIVGSARSKNGSMPSVGFGLHDQNGSIVLPTGARLRATYRQNKTIPMGLILETL